MGSELSCSEEPRPGPGLAGAHRQRQCNRQVSQAGQKKHQKAKRGVIGPVGVIDGEQDRPSLAEVRKQPVEGVENLERLIWEVFSIVVDKGILRLDPDDRASQASGFVEQFLAIRGARAVYHRLEQLAHEREGEIPLELGPTR